MLECGKKIKQLGAVYVLYLSLQGVSYRLFQQHTSTEALALFCAAVMIIIMIIIAISLGNIVSKSHNSSSGDSCKLTWLLTGSSALQKKQQKKTTQPSCVYSADFSCINT